MITSCKTNVNSAENGTFQNISPHCLMEGADICCLILTPIWGKEIVNKSLPTNLKLADISLILP